jgi:homoserine/homoserine lactone efflux protein
MTEVLLLFAITELVLSLSPGPAVLLVISQSLHGGYRAGIAAALGVVLVNITYFILSAIGLGAVLVAAPTVFLIIKYAGAVYLCWTAYEIVHGMVYSGSADQPAKEFGSVAGSLFSSFSRGIFIQAASVKNIIIFVSIIPQFIDPAKDTLSQFIALCLVSFLVEIPVLFGYALITAKLNNLVRSGRTTRYLDGLSAALLIGIAGSVAFSS